MKIIVVLLLYLELSDTNLLYTDQAEYCLMSMNKQKSMKQNIFFGCLNQFYFNKIYSTVHLINIVYAMLQKN